MKYQIFRNIVLKGDAKYYITTRARMSDRGNWSAKSSLFLALITTLIQFFTLIYHFTFIYLTALLKGGRVIRVRKKEEDDR
jgi:hypothetical protein